MGIVVLSRAMRVVGVGSKLVLLQGKALCGRGYGRYGRIAALSSQHGDGNRMTGIVIVYPAQTGQYSSRSGSSAGPSRDYVKSSFRGCRIWRS